MPRALFDVRAAPVVRSGDKRVELEWYCSARALD